MLSLLALAPSLAWGTTTVKSDCDISLTPPPGAFETCLCIRRGDLFWYEDHGTFTAAPRPGEQATLVDTCFQTVDVTASIVADADRERLWPELIKKANFIASKRRYIWHDDTMTLMSGQMIPDIRISPFQGGFELIENATSEVLAFVTTGSAGTPIEALLVDVDGDQVEDIVLGFASGRRWDLLSPLDGGSYGPPPQ